jgi:hypothetical protein
MGNSLDGSPLRRFTKSKKKKKKEKRDLASLSGENQRRVFFCFEIADFDA